MCSSSPEQKKKWYLIPAAFHSPSFSYHIKVTSRASHLALGGTSLEEDNVTILKDVVLTLGHDLALSLELGFRAKLLEHAVVVDDTLDEGLLEVTVNDTGSLRCLGAVADGPLTNLVGTSGEEGAKVEGLAHGDNDLRKGRLCSNLLALLSDLLVRLEARETLLKSNGHGKDGVARGVLLDPFGNLGEVLVLLPDVVALAQVDEVDNGLGCEEEERVDGLDLYNIKSADASIIIVTNVVL